MVPAVALPPMIEPAWELFVAIAVVITIGVVGLARASAAMLRTDEPMSAQAGPETLEAGPSLLANLVITHLGIVAVVGAVVWLTNVPAEALGIHGVPDLANALLLGVGIYAVNEGLGVATKAFGGTAPERYREFLAPGGATEWLGLLAVVLPVLAFSEELLFRGVLIGGVAAGTGLSPWLLAVASSGAFGGAHTAQGRLGILVTGVLGFVLAAVFVVTGDLLLVVIAHYIVNALEFVVHEGMGIDLDRSR